jgi:hypothetical protein
MNISAECLRVKPHAISVRNAQAEDAIERNTTRVSILKNRFAGLTSPHCASLLYNRDTGRMMEIKDEL